MYSKRGFLRKLRKLAASDESSTAQHTLLVTSINYYPGITRKCGETASRELVGAAARAVERAAGDNAVSAYLGEGRFAALLVGQSLASAKCVAESLAKDFGSRESHHESIPRPTLTSAVVAWSHDLTADRLLSEAVATLALAEHSGGDCVLQHGEFADDLANWESEMTTGSPFANVVAQDIMEPFPAMLVRDAVQTELADALLRSGIPVCPYIDREGRLLGVATGGESSSDTFVGDPNRPGSPSISMPETIAHDSSFPEIYEAFSSRGCSTLVVTLNNQPLGYLTCDGFLSMIDPVNSESFADTNVPSDDLRYLAVPSLTSGSAAEPLVASSM